MSRNATMALIAALLSWGIAVSSAQEAPRDVEQLQRQRDRVKQATEEEGSILEAMEEIDRAVQEQESQLEALRARQETVEQRAGALDKERQELELELANRRLYLQKRLRALYKYSTKGFLQAMLAGGTGTDRLKRIRYLQQIVRRDMTLLEEQRGAISRLGEVKTALEVERLQVKELTLKVEAQVTAAQEERERKQLLLGKVRREKTVSQRMIKELEVAAAALSRQVESLPPTTRQAVAAADKTSASDAEEGQGKNEAAVAKKSEAGSGFPSQRGKLVYPVKAGKVTKPFGRYQAPGMKTFDFHRGIDITAPVGVPFRAIYSGEVKLAKWFKGYGLLIIVDHGDGYHSIYAHASKLLKKEGDRVNTGDQLGLVGDTGSFQGPYLYLEVRKNGKAVDPLEWIHVPPDAMQLQ